MTTPPRAMPPLALVPDTPAADDASPLLTAALAYAQLGWPVFPLHAVVDGVCTCGRVPCGTGNGTAGKHPRSRNGLHDATIDETTIRRWWSMFPDANIAVRSGWQQSGGAGWFAVDVDPRHGGDETWAALVAQHGAIPDTVEAITGSGGRHLLFAMPPDFDLRNSAGRLGPGLDTRGNGGYIVVEPSCHVSGGAYVWEAMSCPFDGVVVAPAPAWLLRRLRAPAERASGAPATGGTLGIGTDKVVPPGQRHDYLVRYAALLFSKGIDAKLARDLVHGLNQAKCAPPVEADEVDQIIEWRAGIAVAENAALTERLLAAYTPPPPVVYAPPPASVDAVDALPRAVYDEAPGVLGHLLAYGLQTAMRPVPLLALTAALAIGSVVGARRYMSDQRNFTSLYLCVVARSGTGKEDVKTIIDRVLLESGVPALLGASDFASAGAVFSALLQAPQQVAVLDEFGKVLERGAKGDHYTAATMSVLMQIFSRAHGLLKPPTYSTMTLKDDQASARAPRQVERPALTLCGLTTPSTLYGAVSSAEVVNGFLNRFLVVEYGGPRVPMQAHAPIAVPDPIRSWVRHVLAPKGDLDLLHRREQIAAPALVPYTPEALRRAAAFEVDMYRLADRWERDGLGDLPIRTREIGMRLALIAALAQDPDDPKVDDTTLAWAFTLAEACLRQTGHAIRDRVADTPVQRIRATVLRAVRAAGERGLSERELHRHPELTKLPPRDRKDALDGLEKAGLIRWLTLATRGRPRTALVALDPDAPDDDEPSDTET